MTKSNILGDGLDVIVGSKIVSGIGNGFISITGDARNDGMVFSSSLSVFETGAGDEYDDGVLRVRARRLLNHIY